MLLVVLRIAGSWNQVNEKSSLRLSRMMRETEMIAIFADWCEELWESGSGQVATEAGSKDAARLTGRLVSCVCCILLYSCRQK